MFLFLKYIFFYVDILKHFKVGRKKKVENNNIYDEYFVLKI